MGCVCVCACVVRRRTVLRDADGQLRGHLSDWMVEDRGGGSLVARLGDGGGGGLSALHLVGYLWVATRALCVFACLRVSSFV